MNRLSCNIHVNLRLLRLSAGKKRCQLKPGAKRGPLSHGSDDAVSISSRNDCRYLKHLIFAKWIPPLEVSQECQAWDIYIFFTFKNATCLKKWLLAPFNKICLIGIELITKFWWNSGLISCNAVVSTHFSSFWRRPLRLRTFTFHEISQSNVSKLTTESPYRISCCDNKNYPLSTP